MANRVGATSSLLWTLTEDQIAQPGIVDRIQKALIYSDGVVELSTTKGKILSSIHLPPNTSDTALISYFGKVYWIARQALGHDPYLLPSVKGDGAGAGVSTGKPGTKALSGDILMIYKAYKKRDPTFTLDQMLLEIVESLMAKGWSRIILNKEKIIFDLAWVKGLLQAGADPNTTNAKKQSLLELSCYYALITQKKDDSSSGVETRVSVIRLLIESGADVRGRPDGRPLLEPSCLDSRYWPIFKVLLPVIKAKGKVADLNDRDENGLTLLDKTIRGEGKKNGYLERATELVEAGLDVSQGYPVHEVMYAWSGGSYPKPLLSNFLDLLLKKQPHLDGKDSRGKLILELSVCYPDLFKKFIDAGANLSEPASITAVFCAAIEADADGAIHPYLQGKIPVARGLHFAFTRNKLNYVKKIVQGGVSVDYVDQENPLTCLQGLFKANRWNLDDWNGLKLLLELSADIKKVEEALLLALPWSMKWVFPAAVQYAFRTNVSQLRQAAFGRSVDYVDETYPETCLQTLCRENKWEGEAMNMLHALLTLGADIQRIRGDIFNALPHPVKKLFPELFNLKDIISPLIQKIMCGINSEIYRGLEQSGKMQEIENMLIHELEKLPDIKRLILADSEGDVLTRKKLADKLISSLNNALSKSLNNKELASVICDSLKEWQAQINLEMQTKMQERIRQETQESQRQELVRLAAKQVEMQETVAKLQKQLAEAEQAASAYAQQAGQDQGYLQRLEKTIAEQKQALSGAVHLSSQTQREMAYYGIRLN